MNSPCEIRTMRAADLPFCDHLRQAAGWNQTTHDWQRFLELSPQGCFIAENRGAPVGTVTTIQYGQEIGWIGMLLVEPSARGQGIGKALLQTAIDHLQHQDVRNIKLDATPQGEPLYRTLGFRDEWPLTRFEAHNLDNTDKNRRVRDLAESDLPHLIAMDEKAFGTARPRLLPSLWAASQRAFVLERNERLSGFAFLRSGAVANYFGPIVAGSMECAEILVITLIASAERRAVYWDIPAGNETAVRLASNLGFTPQRPLLRMLLGTENRTGNVKKYFGIADPSLG